MQLTVARPARSAWRLTLIILWVALGALTSLMAVSIGFLFDAPGSSQNPYLIEAAWGLAALPLTFYAGAVGLWFASAAWLRVLFLALPLAASGVAMHGFGNLDSACKGPIACAKPRG